MNIRNPALYLLSALSLFLFCGGSSEQGNSFHVTGRITAPGGNRTCQLALVPEDFNPITDSDDNVIYTESDTCGKYTFEEVTPGNYYLNAFEPEHNERLLRGPLSIGEPDLPLGTDTVFPASYIIADIDVTSSDTVVGLYIKGTTQFVSNINNHRSLAIPSVPSGTVDIISVVKTPASQAPVTRTYVENVTIAATDTVGISYNNRPPYFIGDATQFTRNIELNNAYNDTIDAIDPEGDALTYSLIDGPENMSIDNKSGIVSWSGPPDDSIVASYTYTVKIADSKGAFTTATWKLIPEESDSITPTPAFLDRDSVLDHSQSIGTYQVVSFECAAGPTRYRFLFDESDTTDWSTDPRIQYKWNPDEEKHAFRAQMDCDDYDHPSEWTELFYTLIIADSINYKPSAPLLEGPDTCITGKTFLYTPFSEECNDESTYFVIDWGDGDTLIHYLNYSSIDTIALASHSWHSSGEYAVRIAVFCSEFDSLSDFSDPFHVFVYSDSSEQLPSIKQLPPPPGPDTVLVSDTIFIDADPSICDGAVYQFFNNDSALGDKSNYPYEIYIPDAPGACRFTYSVWCEDMDVPCCTSLTLTVHAVVWDTTMIKELPPPLGPDTVFMFDTILVNADTNVCEEAEYQFFRGDSPLGDKSRNPYAIYIPDVLGTHWFTYKVWCEDREEPTYASLGLTVYAAAWHDTCAPMITIQQVPVVDTGFGIATTVSSEHCSPQYTDCLYRYILDYVAGDLTCSDTSSWWVSDTTFIVPQVPGISVKVSAKSRCKGDSLQYESDWGYEVMELQ